MGRKGWWWDRAPAKQRMYWAVIVFVIWVALLGFAVADFHAYISAAPFGGWLIVVGWPVALPFCVFQFRRARRELQASNG